MAFSNRRRDARMYQIMMLLDKHYALSKEQLARKMRLTPTTVLRYLREMKARRIIFIKYTEQKSYNRKLFYSTMREL